MKLKTIFILLAIVAVLFGFIYIFELRNPDNGEKKSKKLGVIFKISQDNIKRIKITYTKPIKESITLLKKNNGLWQSQPISNDHKTIDNSISAILDRFISNEIKDPEKLADYGLDKPQIKVEFHFQDNTSKRIIIGDEVPIGNYVYIKDESQPNIYMILARIVEDFNKLITANKISEGK